MRVLVFGAGGQLGGVTVDMWRARGDDVAGLTRADVDVTQNGQVADAVARLRPDVLINCSAYNRVDDAEGDPSAAFAVNTWAVRSMARAAIATGAVFVHYSTDFVFDGAAAEPYTEDDSANPQSAYGTSKLMGEWFAAEVPAHYVLRVESLFGGAAARSSVDKMIADFRAGRTVTAFTDRVVSPSFVDDVAAATVTLVTGRKGPGLYHCVNSGATTWFELAEQLRVWLGCNHAPLSGVPVASVPMRARRPQYAALSNARLARAGIAMRPWQDALRAYSART